MRNENLQYPDEFQVDQALQTTSSPQALVLSAYMEEKVVWEKRLDSARVNEIQCAQNIANLKIELAVTKDVLLIDSKKKVESENNLWSKFLKLFKIKTKNQMKHIILKTKIDMFQEELESLNVDYEINKNIYDTVLSNPPSTIQYELAMIGNKLFKSK